jgi:hypothetical protein
VDTVKIRQPVYLVLAAAFVAVSVLNWSTFGDGSGLVFIVVALLYVWQSARSPRCASHVSKDPDDYRSTTLGDRRRARRS